MANEDPTWAELPSDTRELLAGKLAGLWEHPTDADAFDSWAIDKKQAMLLFLERFRSKGLWQLVKRVTNVYGVDGVGLGIEAWPMIGSTLSRRDDFTRLLANHKGTSGGFYEKQRPEAVLHFLLQNGEPVRWTVHFDLYSPVYSPATALKHFRYEYLGNLRPDWRMIAKAINT